MSLVKNEIVFSSTEYIVIEAITYQYNKAEDIYDYFKQRNINVNRHWLYSILRDLEADGIIYSLYDTDDSRSKIYVMKEINPSLGNFIPGVK